MEYAVLAVLWVIIFIAKVFIKPPPPRKMPSPKPLPTNTTGKGSFEIPTLANDPNLPNESVTIFKDEDKPAEVREINFTELYRQRKAEVHEKVSARTEEFKFQTADEKKSSLPFNLTAESAMNAIILSEIFGKPKSLQRR